MNLEIFLNKPEVKSSDKISKWVDTHLKAYLNKNTERRLTEQQIFHILDYFISTKNDPRFRISRISVEEAHRQAVEWVDYLNRKNNKLYKDSPGDTNLQIKFANNYSWVRLKSENSFRREGSLMGHCVASYYNRKNSIIYSLRDDENLPHCTIEVYENRIIQIKGRADRKVVNKYIPYILDFINKNSFPVTNDLVLNDLVTFKGKIYSNNALPEGYSTNQSLFLTNPLSVPKSLQSAHLEISYISSPASAKENFNLHQNRGWHENFNYTEDTDPYPEADLKFNSNILPVDEWVIPGRIIIRGANLRGGTLKSDYLRFIHCRLDIKNIQAKSVHLIKTPFKIERAESVNLTIQGYKEITINETFKVRELLVLKDIDHLVFDTDEHLPEVIIDSVKKITFKNKLSVTNIEISKTPFSSQDLGNLTLSSIIKSNVKLSEVQGGESLVFNHPKINLLTISDSSFILLENISGRALLSDINLELNRSKFDLSY